MFINGKGEPKLMPKEIYFFILKLVIYPASSKTVTSMLINKSCCFSCYKSFAFPLRYNILVGQFIRRSTVHIYLLITYFTDLNIVGEQALPQVHQVSHNSISSCPFSKRQ